MLGLKGNLFLSVVVCLCFFNRYYPSGDAFASGSDDATVSDWIFNTENVSENENENSFWDCSTDLCYSAASMTWGQTEKWLFIPKRASFSGSPVLISLSAVRNLHFVTLLSCLLLNLFQSISEQWFPKWASGDAFQKNKFLNNLKLHILPIIVKKTSGNVLSYILSLITSK